MSSIPRPSSRWVCSIAALFLTALLLAGCAAADPVYLPALTADPMASYSHPDLEEEYRLKQPKHNSWLGGHEVGADVSTSWIPKEGADIDGIIDDMVEKSEAAGWAFWTLEPEPVETGETYWRASKYLDEGLAGLVFRLDPDSWRGGPDLWMHLDFTEEDMATPVLTIERDAEYEALADLLDAVEASGIWCFDFSSELPTVDPGVEPSARCNEYLSLRVFDSREQAQAYLQESTDSETAEGQSFLAGPNWILQFPEEVGFGPYLQSQLGGKLFGAGDGR